MGTFRHHVVWGNGRRPEPRGAGWLTPGAKAPPTTTLHPPRTHAGTSGERCRHQPPRHAADFLTFIQLADGDVISVLRGIRPGCGRAAEAGTRASGGSTHSRGDVFRAGLSEHGPCRRLRSSMVRQPAWLGATRAAPRPAGASRAAISPAPPGRSGASCHWRPAQGSLIALKSPSLGSLLSTLKFRQVTLLLLRM